MNTKTTPSNEDDRDSGYYCPIHSEILKDKPGSCIQCGMPLAKDNTNEEWKDESQ
jgi:hypothetical protein